VTSHIFALTTHVALPPPKLSCGVGSRVPTIGFLVELYVCQISANSNNPQRSYCDLNMANLGAYGVRHLGFDRKWTECGLDNSTACGNPTHIAPAYQISTQSGNVRLSKLTVSQNKMTFRHAYKTELHGAAKCQQYTEWFKKVRTRPSTNDSVIGCRLSAFELYLFILLMTYAICVSEFVLFNNVIKCVLLFGKTAKLLVSIMTWVEETKNLSKNSLILFTSLPKGKMC